MLFASDLGYPSSDLVGGGPKQDIIKQRIQEDFVKADVYFQTLNVQTIRQEKKYSVSKTALKCDSLWPKYFIPPQIDGFFAGLGGALSLFLGMALVMLFEVVEFLFDLFMGVWRHTQGPK